MLTSVEKFLVIDGKPVRRYYSDVEPAQIEREIQQLAQAHSGTARHATDVHSDHDKLRQASEHMTDEELNQLLHREL